MARPASRRVVVSTSTVPRRGRGLHPSGRVDRRRRPPWPGPSAARVAATVPVTTPARARELGRARSETPSLATSATTSRAARTARSASPSTATGVPQTAITASPMNFSMSPPCRPTTWRASSKYCDSTSRTSSGSRASLKGVKPTRSTNSTEHSRRSVSGPAGAGAVSVRGAALSTGVPHSVQNRRPGLSGAAQARQHSTQRGSALTAETLPRARLRATSGARHGDRVRTRVIRVTDVGLGNGPAREYLLHQ